MLKGNQTKQRVSQRPSPRELSEFLQKQGPTCFIDFEFNHSQDPILNLVSCSLQWYDSQGVPYPVREYWLHRDDETKEELRSDLETLRGMGTTFVAYGAAAECRSFISLDLDPHSFKWVDLYAEWRQLTHNNHQCEYGTYFTETGFRRFSTPPHVDKKKNKKGAHGKVGMGLTAAVGQVFGEFIDQVHKRQMRDLIISAPEEFTQEEAGSIMRYCSGDIEYLPDLWMVLTRRLKYATRGMMTDQEIQRAQDRRGSYIASIAKMETTGFPVVIPQIRNLRKNFEAAKDVILEDLTKNHYPFFVRERKRQRDLIGQWVDKYDQFVKFVKSKGLYDNWPRTVDEDTGRPTDTLSRKDEVLGDYADIPEIRAYRSARHLIDQLSWFKEPDPAKLKRDGDFFDTVGSDGRQRAFLGPYGTQTGRNAPKASRFIPAMSSWLRCLIKPEDGLAICGVDWASQEFAIAALMSGDPAMMAAYASGDPYLYFAIKAKAVTQEDGDWWKAQKKLFETLGHDHQCPDLDRFKRVGQARNLFKATTLGLQYGMGALKLAIKLTVDTGRKVSVDEAKKLITLHQKTYPKYWKWLDRVSTYYEKKKVLKLWDGWCLLGDNDNFLSVRNFPVQGTGSVIMREAIRLGHERGLHIMTPLHDALYIIFNQVEESDHPQILQECMDQAVRNVIGEKIKIRQDMDIHTSEEVWVEEKGEKYYKMLSRYLGPMETEGDLLERLKGTIFHRQGEA